jgi:hypothetical protein
MKIADSGYVPKFPIDGNRGARRLDCAGYKQRKIATGAFALSRPSISLMAWICNAWPFRLAMGFHHREPTVSKR